MKYELYGPGTGETPGNFGDSGNYVSQVATRYKGKIGHCEVLNEPVLHENERSCWKKRTFWRGSAAEVLELTRKASGIVTSIEPNAKIVAPGFVGGTSEQLDLY